MPDPADLRAAALSDLRHPSGTGTGQLHILLPDVPGEPFGGTATPAQRQATAEATGQYVPAQLFPGKATRPHDLRALLRAWAASQPRPDAVRWEIRPYNTPNEHTWVILRDSKAVAEVYDRRDAEFVLAALQARDQQPQTRCTATKTEQVDHVPTMRRCTRPDTPEAHADGYHQWMRPGHRVRWPVRPGTDNAAGLRGAIARLSQLDAQGRPL